jgi:hypothetical protein
MTPQEIQDRNKQIALMLGDSMQKIVEQNGYHYPSDEELLFDSDWNWLMESVEFVKSITDKNLEELKYEVTHLFITSSKKRVFIAVSDFAKLYNEKKL